MSGHELVDREIKKEIERLKRKKLKLILKKGSIEKKAVLNARIERFNNILRKLQ